MRQFQFRVGPENFALIHVSLVPDMHGEQKTKPTQATVRDLRGLGLMPDLIACRVLIPQPLGPETKSKISMFCHVTQGQVIGIHDVSSVYHVPLLLREQGIVQYLQKRLSLASVEKPTAMVERGEDIQRRWKDMTDVIGYVAFESDDFCLLRFAQERSLPRFSQYRLSREIHRHEGFIYVSYQVVGAFRVTLSTETANYCKVFLKSSISTTNRLLVGERRASRTYICPGKCRRVS